MSAAWSLPLSPAWPPASAPASLADLAHQIAYEHEVSVAELRGLARTERLVIPRHRFMAEAYETRRYSMTQIGRYLSGRERQAVRYGIAHHLARMGVREAPQRRSARAQALA